jgi:hypothetical protein
MEFSAQDAAAFWPIYNEYDEALDKLADSRIELIKEYSSVYGAVSDEQAAKLGQKWIDMQIAKELPMVE